MITTTTTAASHSENGNHNNNNNNIDLSSFLQTYPRIELSDGEALLAALNRALRQRVVGEDVFEHTQVTRPLCARLNAWVCARACMCVLIGLCVCVCARVFIGR